MGSQFTFYDYVDDGGGNVILFWLSGSEVTPEVHAKFDKWIRYLEETPISKWNPKYAKQLKKNCRELLEVRVVFFRRQYRILFCHGPGRATPTLLHGFRKSDDDIDSECQEAFKRRSKVDDDPNKHRVEHNW